MRGAQCRMANLRNGNVPYHYFCNIHVDLKIQCIFSHVEFKKWPMTCPYCFPMSKGFTSLVNIFINLKSSCNRASSFSKPVCSPLEGGIWETCSYYTRQRETIQPTAERGGGGRLWATGLQHIRSPLHVDPSVVVRSDRVVYILIL